ncbi:acyl-[acyl-carrier-protein] thioesterase [Salinibacter altiplanensis]|uniref:acyl-[acyl-carrier-protein] thioesterase n=1 Tax=Salinibacter altiplanensis TaxID=1803181 RepID=UPI000C9F225B|nr:acyl-ACP thioesterase domain-containing protein [Salinibacter altiplanensis]
MSLPLAWTETVSVRTSDLTPHGTASTPALCVYLQEAAGHHADALGVSMRHLRGQNQAWVLSHMHLDLDRLPGGDEAVTVETWPSGLNGLYATREFLLSVDDTEMGRATSRWFVIDTERRRPVRPPRLLYDLEMPRRPPPLPHAFEDLSTPNRVDHETAWTARYHDLDLNRHVNSVRYLEWALGALPNALLDVHRCTGLALQFRAEATAGTPVRTTAQAVPSDEGKRIRHALHHAQTDALLAAARTTWAPHD